MLYRSIASFISPEAITSISTKNLYIFPRFIYVLFASFRSINFVTLILYQRIILFSLYSSRFITLYFLLSLRSIIFIKYKFKLITLYQHDISLHLILPYILFHLFLKFHHVKWFTFFSQLIHVTITIILHQ